jgi:hypothetical protein
VHLNIKHLEDFGQDLCLSLLKVFQRAPAPAKHAGGWQSGCSHGVACISPEAAAMHERIVSMFALQQVYIVTHTHTHTHTLTLTLSLSHTHTHTQLVQIDPDLMSAMRPMAATQKLYRSHFEQWYASYSFVMFHVVLPKQSATHLDRDGNSEHV